MLNIGGVKNKMVNAEEMFSCGHCKRVYKGYNEALECCEGDQVWVCGECEHDWEDDKEGAEDCCKETKK